MRHPSRSPLKGRSPGILFGGLRRRKNSLRNENLFLFHQLLKRSVSPDCGFLILDSCLDKKIVFITIIGRSKTKDFRFGKRFRKVLKTAVFAKLLWFAFGILIPSFREAVRNGRLLDGQAGKSIFAYFFCFGKK